VESIASAPQAEADTGRVSAVAAKAKAARPKGKGARGS